MTDRPAPDTGSDGLPVCDEFACRMWGCWCPRIDGVLAAERCEHGRHPGECSEHEEVTP